MRQITNLKSWQEAALGQGRPSRYFLIQSPGGAGKSLLQVMLAQADIEETGNKQLILVPKNHIHYGFFDADAIEFTLPGNTRPSHWIVKGNFCSTSKNDAKTKMLKDFLLADVRELRKANKLAAIATHRAMIYAWTSMSRTEKNQALRNISFRIDEAHHLSNVFHDTDLDLFNRKDKQDILDDATRLGVFLQYVLRHGDSTVKVHLATATFFRGDKRTILSERFKNDFAHFYLPWDQHFQTLGIDHLTFDYLTYLNDPIESLLTVVATEPAERHLIIIPALNHRFRKKDTLSRITDGLRRILPSTDILDLVTKETQEHNKIVLHKQPDQFRAVVACRLFDEGTDWVPCTRLHNTDACESSVTLAVQRIFRPLRQHPSKTNVRIINYLPNFSSDMSLEEKRQAVSNRFNAFLACIITQGELMPSLIRLKGEPKGTKPRKTTSLQEVYGESYPEVMAALVKGYEGVQDKEDSGQIEAVAEEVLKKFGIPEDIESADLKDALLHQLVRIASPKTKTLDRKALEIEAIDAEGIRQQGFDKVWEQVSPVPSVLCMGTENIDAATIRELLSIVREIPTLEEIHAAIQEFYDRTGKRPTFHQSEWFTELERSAGAVDKLLQRHYGTTLAKEIRVVLGHASDELRERTRAVIEEYWSRGIRLGNKYGDIPELGITSFALNGRLLAAYQTTLAKEVESILGPLAKPLAVEDVRRVVREYREKGVRLHRKYGFIPELDMSSFNLADRLKRTFSIKLSDLVKEEFCESVVG